MRPYQTFHVLEEIRRSVDFPLRRDGVILSDGDRDTVKDIYQQWLLSLIDLGYLPPDSLSRDARRLWSDMLQVDVLTLNNAFAECLSLVRLKTARGFKVLCQTISSHLFHLLKSDIEMMSEGDVLSAKRLVQLFSYTSRLSLKDIDLTQQMIDAYLESEMLIPETFPDNIVCALNKIVRRWMGPFLPAEIVPRHGPGGVAQLGRCSLFEKYSDLRTDTLLEYAFGKPWWIVSEPQKLERTSQTIFVPKSYKTFRTISMEPATLQYFQQGVWRVIDDLTFRNKYLRNHIGFHDSFRNCLLAREGSISRRYATIDLSAASDSVSYDLVKRVFKGTWLLRYIVATRSTHTLLPDGRKIELRKFAPMGSSLCFPIETILFASICEHVTQAHRAPGDYSVVGDDIIVPRTCAEAVVRILTVLGFRVNDSKSFIDSACWFRESCGGEYCDGYDVTPMRVSRKYSHSNEVVRATQLVSLANSAYLSQYRHLRHFFIEKMRRIGFVPLFAPTHLMSDNYTNYHTKTRWNRRLQRTEALVDTFASLPDRFDPESEELRYRNWLERTYLRKSYVEPFISRVTRTTVIKKRSWVCAYDGILDQDAAMLAQAAFSGHSNMEWV